MFFKYIVLLFSGDIALCWCTFLEIVNNLKLTNVNRGENKTKKIIEATGPEIIESFTDIITNVVGAMRNIARTVSNMRLVTDVR